MPLPLLNQLILPFSHLTSCQTHFWMGRQTNSLITRTYPLLEPETSQCKTVCWGTFTAAPPGSSVAGVFWHPRATTRASTAHSYLSICVRMILTRTSQEQKHQWCQSLPIEFRCRPCRVRSTLSIFFRRNWWTLTPNRMKSCSARRQTVREHRRRVSMVSTPNG
jgi:hypothetical protein